MSYTHSTDIVIFGGGIAGLWLLARLRRAGYKALLLEADALGSGQTIASQGIIHGGLKYALGGTLNEAAQAAAAMPARWRACLGGSGRAHSERDEEMDLRGVKILSPHYYMWSVGGAASKLKTYLGSKSLRGRVEPVKDIYYRDKHLPLFQGSEARGSLYQLADFVLDVPSLLQALSEPHRDAIFAIDSSSVAFQRDQQGSLSTVQVASKGSNGSSATIKARLFVFAAGAGNDDLCQRAGMLQARSQRRPLKMVYVKQQGLPPAFVHCLATGFSPTPALSITTHSAENGAQVWYLGGDLAERGVTRSDEEQIDAAKAALSKQFPWLAAFKQAADTPKQAAHWGTLSIDRAEAAAKGGLRPDHASLHSEDGALAVWPTKLTLSPALADKVIDYLKQQVLQPRGLQPAAEQGNGANSLAQSGFKPPPIARPCWDD